GAFATVTVATLATVDPLSGQSVATVAGVTVATPTDAFPRAPRIRSDRLMLASRAVRDSAGSACVCRPCLRVPGPVRPALAMTPSIARRRVPARRAAPRVGQRGRLAHAGNARSARHRAAPRPPVRPVGQARRRTGA